MVQISHMDADGVPASGPCTTFHEPPFAIWCSCHPHLLSQATAGSSAGPSLLAAAKSKGAAKLEAALAEALPAPSPPAAGGPRGTLIVCPLSVLSNWGTQLEEHTDGSLSVSALSFSVGLSRLGTY